MTEELRNLIRKIWSLSRSVDPNSEYYKSTNAAAKMCEAEGLDLQKAYYEVAEEWRSVWRKEGKIS